MKDFQIGKNIIGEKHPAFIIAEMSGNHGGSLERAKNIILKAKECGADAVKLQTYKADTITMKSDKEDFLLPKDSPWYGSKTLYDLYEEAHTPWEWHKELFEYAKKLDLIIFSSPFDETAVDLLEELGAPAYKIASPEVTHIPLIKKVAKTKKPVILSSGVANQDDLELAVKTLVENGCTSYVILKCTTAYPAPYEDSNLLTIPLIEKTFNCFTGLSDHTLGDHGIIAAIALGAKVIEKHFIDDKSKPTVDSFFSSDPEEFKQMMVKIREVEKMMGVASFELAPSAKNNLRGRRSLYMNSNLKSGEIIKSEDIKCVRPSMGLHPKYYEQILGKKLKVNKEKGDRISINDFE